MSKSNRGITLIALVITIIILLILAAITISFLMGDNGIIQKAILAKDKTEEAARTEKLELAYVNDYLDYTPTIPIPNTDFIQPWLMTNYTESQIEEHFRNLKKVGINNIVLQWIVEVEGGKNGTEVQAKNIWYDSPSISREHIEYTNVDLLKKIMTVAGQVDMQVYVGLTVTSEWWANAFEDSTWCDKNAAFMNTVISEVNSMYGNHKSFAGWYWGMEMYSNTNQYETQWAYMINQNIKEINQLSSAKKVPLMIAPCISSLYHMSEEQYTEQWKRAVSLIDFREGDIICLQDGIRNSKFDLEYITNAIKGIRAGIKESSGGKVKFWIDVEIYRGDQPENFEVAMATIKLSSLYAENLALFSYSHYYLPTGDSINNQQKIELNQKYEKFLEETYGKVYHPIPEPEEGSIYADEEGECVPVPKGFTVSKTENRVKDGLVIEDEWHNQFVWIPVNAGLLERGYTYTSNETYKVGYTRYINNYDLTKLKKDTLPKDVIAEEAQIHKYMGFYVARYSASFDYNGGNARARTQYNEQSKAADGFTWQYADMDYYSGMAWNNINYQDAKIMAEKMASSYGYHTTIKTGLITGNQWDTMLRWMDVTDSTHNKIADGRTWGNYTDASEPATTGNYEQGKLQPTGSNEAWKYKNIYDIAGNLSSWTTDYEGSSYLRRSNGYSGNGQYGNPSYGDLQPIAGYRDVGFRVVLYIQ